ncbi:MAG: hypothetical protein ACRD3G_12115 [Vicinamibacterales bacterium]
MRSHGHAARINGRETPEYRSWRAMRDRCGNPKVANYDVYGGRGIRVCERWQNSFEAFLEDMGPKPSAAHTIDRKDRNGHYEPDNCVWATRREQSQHLTSTRLLTFRGRTQSLSAWGRELGLGGSAISRRLKRGWSIEEALGNAASAASTT